MLTLYFSNDVSMGKEPPPSYFPYILKFTKGASARSDGSVGVENRSRGDTISFDHVRNTSAKYDFSRNSDVLSRVSSSFASEDVPDAAS
ncbi:RNA polymerase II-associated protein 3-like, partial [Trifolium medium]|nr:RNA polymerase II-associated protein 3-like [Trifolium medium]MCI19207.1 RNA polymerase II-associated protein 3-like [Trifolium medium]